MRNLRTSLRDSAIRAPTSALGMLERSLDAPRHPTLACILTVCSGEGSGSPRAPPTIMGLLRSETDAKRHPTLKKIFSSSTLMSSASASSTSTSLLSPDPFRHPTLCAILGVGYASKQITQNTGSPIKYRNPSLWTLPTTTLSSLLSTDPYRHPTLCAILLVGTTKGYASKSMQLLDTVTIHAQHPTLRKILAQQLCTNDFMTTLSSVSSPPRLRMLNPKEPLTKKC